MVGQPSTNANGSVRPANRAAGERVVTDDSTASMYYVHSDAFGLVIGQCKATKPLCEFRLSAVESRNIMVGPQGLDFGKRRLRQSLTKYARRLKQASKAGLLYGWSVQRFRKRRPVRVVEKEESPIGERSLRLDRCCV